MIRYFSVDEEFSGLNHLKNDLLSIGMVEIIHTSLFKIDYMRKFYIELKPVHNEYDKESMKINGLNLDKLKEYGVSHENAVREIKKYMDLREDDTAVFVGYCTTLDKIFFDQLFLETNQKNPFNYEVIDISSLGIGKLGLSWGYSEKELLSKLHIKDTEDKHNALADAILQAQEFCALMNK